MNLLASNEASETTNEPVTISEQATEPPNENINVKKHHKSVLAEIKINIPRISSRELHAQRPHSPVNEREQREYVLIGPGSKREVNKLNIKLKNVELDECIKRAKKYAMEQSVRFVLVKQQQQQQKQQLDLIKKQQALLLMCRIYVGSIFYEVKEEIVRSSFSQFGPIRSISMSWDAATNKHKGFAFIEFETPEAAQLSLDQMNGLLLGGRNIKVGRPSNMPQAQPIIDQLTEEAKNYNRIYIASIHSELSEQDVQSVFEAFGTIKSISLVRDPQTGKHKGFGFIEYETVQAAQDAIASMNLFDLGGQLLRVGKAVTPPEGVINPAVVIAATPAIAAAAAAALQSQEALKNSNIAPAQPSTSITNSSATIDSPSIPLTIPTTQPTISATSSLNSPTIPAPSTGVNMNQTLKQTTPSPIISNDKSVELTENQKKLLGMTSADDPTASLEQQVDITLKGKEQRLLLMQKLMQRKQESTILILRNMVGPEDIDEELESEITDECGKYGEVERVVIYQERQSEDEEAEIIVKIFVEFSMPKSVDLAVEALNGRFFAGRMIKAEIYDLAAYSAKDYSA